MSTGSPSPIPTPEEEESYSSWALCILCMLLIGALWMSYYLQVRRIRAVHETVVSIFAGQLQPNPPWPSPRRARARHAQ